MAPTNKTIIWTSQNEADRFDADLHISLLNEIVFYKDGKEVKRYNKHQFEKYNPDWDRVENAE